jgi:BASS family bile acid:Na+ symporter
VILADISVQQHVFPFVVFLFSIAIGIELTPGHFRALFLRPRAPILGTLIHTFTFPLVAGVLVLGTLNLGFQVADYLLIGILLIAACPSGGFSNMLVLLARADIALSVLLTAVSTMLSFITVPLFFWLFGLFMPDMSGDIELPVGETLIRLLLMVVIPVGLGMVWRHFQSDFVVRHTTRMQNYCQIALYITVIVILVEQWDTLVAGLGPAMPWSLGICVIALSLGYGISRLVGLSPVDCATVAIEGSIRNLAVAFLIATSVMNRVDVAILPSVYFGAVLLIGLTFARFWRTRMAPRYASNGGRDA